MNLLHVDLKWLEAPPIQVPGCTLDKEQLKQHCTHVHAYCWNSLLIHQKCCIGTFLSYQQLYAGTHHITLLSEEAITSTLWGHPSYRKLHVSITLLPAVVVSTVDILSQAKICHFYHPIGINPIDNTLCAVCGSLNLQPIISWPKMCG